MLLRKDLTTWLLLIRRTAVMLSLSLFVPFVLSAQTTVAENDIYPFNGGSMIPLIGSKIDFIVDLKVPKKEFTIFLDDVQGSIDSIAGRKGFYHISFTLPGRSDLIGAKTALIFDGVVAAFQLKMGIVGRTPSVKYSSITPLTLYLKEGPQDIQICGDNFNSLSSGIKLFNTAGTTEVPVSSLFLDPGTSINNSCLTLSLLPKVKVDDFILRIPYYRHRANSTRKLLDDVELANLDIALSTHVTIAERFPSFITFSNIPNIFYKSDVTEIELDFALSDLTYSGNATVQFFKDNAATASTDLTALSPTPIAAGKGKLVFNKCQQAGEYTCKISYTVGSNTKEFQRVIRIADDPAITSVTKTGDPANTMSFDLRDAGFVAITGTNLTDLRVRLLEDAQSQIVAFKSMDGDRQNRVFQVEFINKAGVTLNKPYTLQTYRISPNGAFKKISPATTPTMTFTFRQIPLKNFSTVKFKNGDNEINFDKSLVLIDKHKDIKLSINGSDLTLDDGQVSLAFKAALYDKNATAIKEVTWNAGQQILKIQRPGALFNDGKETFDWNISKAFEDDDFYGYKNLKVTVYSAENASQPFAQELFSRTVTMKADPIEKWGLVLNLPPFLYGMTYITEKETTPEGQKEKRAFKQQIMTLNTGFGVKRRYYRRDNKKPTATYTSFYLAGLNFADLTTNDDGDESEDGDEAEDGNDYRFIERGTFALLLMQEFRILNFGDNSFAPVMVGLGYASRTTAGKGRMFFSLGFGVSIQLGNNKNKTDAGGG